jgi:hypothetical protein
MDVFFGVERRRDPVGCLVVDASDCQWLHCSLKGFLVSYLSCGVIRNGVEVHLCVSALLFITYVGIILYLLEGK